MGERFNVVDGHTTWRRYTEAFRAEALPTIPEDGAPAIFTFRGTISNTQLTRMPKYAPQHSYQNAIDESLQSLRERNKVPQR